MGEPINDWSTILLLVRADLKRIEDAARLGQYEIAASTALQALCPDSRMLYLMLVEAHNNGRP